MPTATIRARSTPYPAELRTNQRVCKRCGIHFRVNSSRDTHRVECRDCVDVAKNKCGTPAGPDSHRRAGNPLCPACTAVETANRRKYGDKRRTTKTGHTSPTPSPCGTPEAYARHQRLNEPIDDTCRAWRAATTAAANKARRDNTKDCGTLKGYRRHKRHGTEVCEPCRAAVRAYDNNYYQRKKTA